MKTAFRFIAAVPGVLMLISGINWIRQPSEAAQALGMPLLDGIGRSTQIGDFAAFFLVCAAFIFIGAIRSQGQWLYAGAGLLGTAALMRTLAWSMHGADFATQFIAAEVIMAVWLVASGYFIDRKSDTGTESQDV